MNKRREPTMVQQPVETAADSPRNVTLRVYNLKPMKKFYQDLLGFKLLGEFPSAALLKVDAHSGARFQMLGLLQRSVCSGPDRNTVGHVTFILSVPDHESERKRLENLGLRVDTMQHERTGKRSLRFRDPEGNEVELLCQWQHQ